MEVESSIECEVFDFNVEDEIFQGHAIYLEGCIYLWLNSGASLQSNVGSMSNLVAAFQTKYSNAPLATTLMSHGDEEAAQILSTKISQKFGLNAFVSCTLEDQSMDKMTEILGNVFRVIKGKLDSKKSE